MQAQGSAGNEDVVRILVVSDARGTLFKRHLETSLRTMEHWWDLDMVAHHEQELSLDAVYNVVEVKYGDRPKFDFIYVMAGVTDLFTMNQGRAVAKYESVGDLVDEMTDKYYALRNKLFKFALRPVMCLLVGIDLDKFNNEKYTQYREQTVINESIYHLNRAIQSINTDCDAVGPWLGQTVHAVIHHKLHHKYRKLPDGLNPDQTTLKEWAKIVVKTIVKNNHWPDKEDQ